MPVPLNSPSVLTISVSGTVANGTTSRVAVTSLASAVESSVSVSSISVFDVAGARSRRSSWGILADSGLTNLRNTTVASGKMAVAVTRETNRLDIRSLLADSRSTELRGSVLASKGTVCVIGSLRKSVLASKSSISTVGVDLVGSSAGSVAAAEAEGLSTEGSAIENAIATRSDRSGGSLRSDSVGVSKECVSAVSSGAGLLSTEVVSLSGTESIAKCDVSTRASGSNGSSGSLVRGSKGGVVAVSSGAV